MFQIRTDLVKRHSEVFMTKLETDAVTGHPKLRINEHFAQHFKLSIAFLYTGQIYSIPEDESSHLEWRLLADLWSMGHALGSITFKDAVVDGMIQRRVATKGYYSSHIYKYLAKHLQTEKQVQTGVGKLLVDTALSQSNHEVYTSPFPKPECVIFYGEIIRKLNKIHCGSESESQTCSRAMEGKNCVYHEHGSDGVCYNNMFPLTKRSVRFAQNATPQYEPRSCRRFREFC
jgi:hypothetical protein